ncbi:unnamed protein product, partial [Prorocentrum cordatum]
ARIGAEWRKEATKSFNNRDFDAKGSNLFSSRDFMLNARAEKEGLGSRAAAAAAAAVKRRARRAKRTSEKEEEKAEQQQQQDFSDVAPKKREGSPAVAFVREKFRAPTRGAGRGQLTTEPRSAGYRL